MADAKESSGAVGCILGICIILGFAGWSNAKEAEKNAPSPTPPGIIQPGPNSPSIPDLDGACERMKRDLPEFKDWSCRKIDEDTPVPPKPAEKLNPI
jgi:hypothetical protein